MFRKCVVLSSQNFRGMSKKFKPDIFSTKAIAPALKTEVSGKRLSGSASTEESLDTFTILPTPLRSPADKKVYTVIKLANGLTATLISDEANLIELDEFSDGENEYSSDDASSIGSQHSRQSSGFDARSNKLPPTEEKLAACSLSIAAGSFSDPEDIQGLAHFLEHMVFMGSTKYPKENEFDSFITKNGGSDNASTDCENTTFYFECQEKHLEKALDIFSQFFKNPLMKKEAMTRERKAIDSEFQLSLPSDTYRKQQIICSTAHKNNPARKFAWGNQKTLMDDVTDDYLYKSVHDFRDKHYSAHRMALAIQARLPEKTLREWVIAFFSGIKSNSEPLPKFKVEAPFTDDFNKLYHIESISDVCRLDMNWILPPVLDLYKKKPLGYLSSVIGDEGKGSLLSFLKKKLWALSLHAGNSEEGLMSNSVYSVFSISVFLTELGRKHINDVLHAVFSYLKMLTDKGPCVQQFKEMQAIAEISFKYKEESTAAENVENLSENMLVYPVEDYLTGGELFFEFDSAEITRFLELMTPANVNVMISAKGTSEKMILDKVEPWFQTKYKRVDMPREWLSDWYKVTAEPHFHLPLRNEFITTNFSLLEPVDVPKFPDKIQSTNLIDIWYKQDDKFLLPVAYIGIQIVSNQYKNSALGCVLSMIYLRTLKELLSEELYQATAALLEYSLETSENGISFSVYGFNQNLNLILSKIADKISNFNEQNNIGLFIAVKEALLRSSNNENLNPRNVARDLRMSIIVDGYYTGADKYRALKVVTYDMLKLFASELFKEVHAQCLVQGNVTIEESKKICEGFVNKLNCTNLSQENFPKFKVFELPLGEKCIRMKSFNVHDKNCITTNYYQFCPGNIKEYVTLELLLLMMEEPLFDKLRTQEQLGYDVSCTVRETYGIIGFTITVHSQVDKFSMEHIENRMLDFLNNFSDYVKKMPDDEFKEAAKTLIQIKNCIDVHLKEEVQRNWSEIKHLEYIFNRYEKEIKSISSLKKKNLINLLKKYLHNQKKLTIQVIGHDDSKMGESEKNKLSAKYLNDFVYELIKDSPHHPSTYFISDIHSFKRGLTPFPYWKLVQ